MARATPEASRSRSNTTLRIRAAADRSARAISNNDTRASAITGTMDVAPAISAAAADSGSRMHLAVAEPEAVGAEAEVPSRLHAHRWLQ
jgi:hypothetical protein